MAQEPYTDALDEQLLRVDRGRCTARAGEEIHRETEGGLADGTRVQMDITVHIFQGKKEKEDKLKRKRGMILKRQ